MKYNLDKSEQQYDNLTYDGSSVGELSHRKIRRRTVYIVAAVIIAVVVVLALGLGIGLGTRSDSGSSSGKQGANQGTDRTSSKPATQTTQTTQKFQTSTEQTRTTTQNNDWLSLPCVDQEAPPSCPWNSSENPLLLVSLDGFKAEYILRNLTPVIQKLRTCGVHTPYMRSAFPTLTFPNHYTIVTGLYPESSGIVGNSMYDPSLNESFKIGSSNSYHPYWWGGEPLWSTAKRQGKKTASYFWVGSDVNISGVYPDIWNKYNGSVPFEQRVDTVIDWLLKDKTKRPDFITLYFNEPDHTGHGSGPDSPEVDEMLGKVDNIIKRLMNGLLRQQLDHCVNIIILADHGMAPTSCERQVDLNAYLHDVNKMLIYDGTTGHINPHYYKSGSVVVENSNPLPVSDIIKHLECKNSHLNVFTRDTIPKRHHYTNSKRIGDVIVDIESSWLFYDKKSNWCLDGNHGYDNIYKSMHALFLAYGPDFKQNLEVKPFENIELYNLMAELIHIKPAPNNGTIGSLNHLLRIPAVLPQLTNAIPTCTSNKTRGSSPCSCQDSTDDFPWIEKSEANFPFGLPLIEVDMTVCLLPGYQFTSLFSHVYKIPAVTSYILNRQKVIHYNPDNDTCITADPRLSERSNPDCLEYNNIGNKIEFSRLFDAGFAQNDTEKTEGYLSSNIAPMYTGFKHGIWSYLWRAIREYVTIYGELSVAVGPIFEYRIDGHWDPIQNVSRMVSNTSTVPLPTHYYVILVKCKDNSTALNTCSADDLDILSFILPHQPKTHNCIPDKDFLENNVARIRDIEELTGLQFMTRFDTATGARLRTFLPTALWSAPVVTPWAELPCTFTTDHCPPGRPPVLLISLDGFRANYLKRHLTPTIERLSQCGVHTPYMRSVYPTVTFPNHYSIVTGLYPESHGIVYNKMFDEKIGKIFTISKSISKDPRWWKGEPLWITAQKQGLKTATYFWPGSDVNITGRYPDVWKHYNGAAGYTERVYEVLSWLDMPEETRPDFITLYFDQPDHAGHSYGPESEGVNGQLQTVDELIDILMANLYERNLQNCINIIIIADHGFDDISCDKTVTVSDYYHNITKMLMFERVFGQVFPQFVKNSSSTAQRNNQEFSVQDITNSLSCKHPAMNVFTKDTLPKRHHFANSDRIAPVLLDMETEWMVFDDRSYFCKGGNHGWDNIYKSMHALFLGHGPSFKQNFTAEPFENIELYNMMSELLGIVPAPNNGTAGSLRDMLLSPKDVVFADTVSNICNPSGGKAIAMCGCSKINVSDINIISENAISVVRNTLVFGVPYDKKNDSLCSLTDNGHSAWGFSKTFRAPLWISTLAHSATIQNKSDKACILNDPRVAGETINCTEQLDGNYTIQSLMIDGTSSLGADVELSSTLVPMYKGFQKGIWQFVNELVRDYVSIYESLSVTSGVIYDYNNDGLWEGTQNETRYADDDKNIPVPSDIYIILAKCKTKNAQLPCEGDVDLLSFIIPHLQEVPNCLSNKDYLRDNVARIRDIELLTGLQFMTFHTNKTARLRTFLAEELWDSHLFKTWSDTQCKHKDQCQSDYRPVMLLSLSGFRADYLMRNFTPNLKRMSECGVSAPYMRAVYPTKTYPNHYTIVTGLYPESHGIIDDSFYDPSIGKKFDSKNVDSIKDSRWWNAAEPIWTRAKQQGLKTAAYSWPGSYINMSGGYPDIWKEADASGSYLSQVNEILSWITLPKGERPDFIAIYMNEPDTTGRNVGPSNTAGIGAALAQVDDAVGKLMAGLYEKGLHNCVNLVVVSDHGMADVSCKRLQRLKNYVNYDFLNSNFYVWDGAVGRISDTYTYNRTFREIFPNPDPVSFDTIMKNISCKSHLRPYQKTNLPVRLHYSNNDRIDDIVLDMDSEWLVTRSYIADCRGGDSGYDNINQDMQALFLAHGPAFKQNTTVEPFENIELYNMLAAILNITTAPNNGTAGSLNHLLQQVPDIPKIVRSLSYRDTHLLINSATEFARFINASDCSSSCSNLNDAKLSEILTGLNMSDGSQHIPWGLPVLNKIRFQNSTVDVLHQSTHVTAFDPIMTLPLWVSQTFNLSQLRSTLNIWNCNIPDPRLPNGDSNCSLKDDMQWTSLLHEENKTMNTNDDFKFRLSSTLVSMIQSFTSDIWSELQIKISEWIQIYKNVNVVSGPVYDYNSDGIADSRDSLYNLRQLNSTVSASHFFVIVSRCKTIHLHLDKCGDILTSAFIIPHVPATTSCMPITDFLATNEARVRDVEIITGLQFFSNIPINDRAKLQTSLPHGLWTFS